MRRLLSIAVGVLALLPGCQKENLLVGRMYEYQWENCTSTNPEMPCHSWITLEEDNKAVYLPGGDIAFTGHFQVKGSTLIIYKQ